MKTIKDAVIELSGRFPIDFSEIKSLKDVGGKYFLFSGSVFERLGDTMFKFLCSPQEFKDTSKELGYINGYRWGVEYPTNGKRPDLPDDLLVDRNYGYRFEYGQAEVFCVDWLGCKSFKISDPRYKPSDTGYLNAVSEIAESKPDAEVVSEKPESKQNAESVTEWFENNAPTVYGKKDESNWHERGELPPVGCDDFEWSLNGKCWEHGLMLFNDGVTCLIANKKYPANRHHLKSIDPDLIFRPIRTDREKVIDAAVMAVESNNSTSESIYDTLYNAGMLVLPPRKSDTED